MSPGAMLDAADEAALQAFLGTLPEAHAVAVRTLAHSWQAAGGFLQVGRVTVRLCARGRDGRAFTAGTLHADLRAGPALEVGRVLLANHGVGDADWRGWCDDLAGLELGGFDAAAKYPAIRLDGVPAPTLVRLAQALRDLGRLAQGHAA